MKRYPLVIGATAAGLAGVLTFHTHEGVHALQANGSLPGASTTTTLPPTGSSSTSTTTTSPSQGHVTTAAGKLLQYGYGVLSVRVTVSGSKITNVSIGTLQTVDTYSQQLAQQVIPMLQREVLAAQSARISAISGATYTSEAYDQSLQSALDKLNFK